MTRPSGLVAWVVLLFFGPILLRMGWLTWRLWRHGEPFPDKRRGAHLRELPRISPADLVAIACMIDYVDTYYFFGTGSLALKVVVDVGLALFFPAGILAISVRSFGRPRWLIAPVLRKPKPRTAGRVGR